MAINTEALSLSSLSADTGAPVAEGQVVEAWRWRPRIGSPARDVELRALDQATFDVHVKPYLDPESEFFADSLNVYLAKNPGVVAEYTKIKDRDEFDLTAVDLIESLRPTESEVSNGLAVARPVPSPSLSAPERPPSRRPTAELRNETSTPAAAPDLEAPNPSGDEAPPRRETARHQVRFAVRSALPPDHPVQDIFLAADAVSLEMAEAHLALREGRGAAEEGSEALRARTIAITAARRFAAGEIRKHRAVGEGSVSFSAPSSEITNNLNRQIERTTARIEKKEAAITDGTSVLKYRQRRRADQKLKVQADREKERDRDRQVRSIMEALWSVMEGVGHTGVRLSKGAMGWMTDGALPAQIAKTRTMAKARDAVFLDQKVERAPETGALMTLTPELDPLTPEAGVVRTKVDGPNNFHDSIESMAYERSPGVVKTTGADAAGHAGGFQAAESLAPGTFAVPEQKFSQAARDADRDLIRDTAIAGNEAGRFFPGFARAHPHALGIDPDNAASRSAAVQDLRKLGNDELALIMKDTVDTHRFFAANRTGGPNRRAERATEAGYKVLETVLRERRLPVPPLAQPRQRPQERGRGL